MGLEVHDRPKTVRLGNIERQWVVAPGGTLWYWTGHVWVHINENGIPEVHETVNANMSVTVLGPKGFTITPTGA